MTNQVLNDYPCGCEIRKGDKIDAYIRPCALHDAAPDLPAALRGLVAAISLKKLNIRKDFHLLNVHACANKAIAKAEGRTQ